jgi:hypothetical protein
MPMAVMDFFSRLVTHAVTIAVSGVVAWATSVYFEGRRAANEEQRIALELGKDKIEIGVRALQHASGAGDGCPKRG